MTQTTMTMEELVAKVQELKKDGPIDLSTEEDLALAVMNLISLEEHLFFTGAKTGNDAYWATSNEVREMRKSLLARMIPRNEGETWCSSKHLLSATMRLIEVGTKLFADGKKNEAKDMYEKAHELFSIFWALRLKLVTLPEAAKSTEGEIGGVMTTKDIMNKLVDCCKE